MTQVTIDLRVPKMVQFASGSIGNQWESPELKIMDRWKAGLRVPSPMAPRFPAESVAGGTAPRLGLPLTGKTKGQCSSCFCDHMHELKGGGYIPALDPRR